MSTGWLPATRGLPARMPLCFDNEVVGAILAMCSNLLIWSSLVFKKKSLLHWQAGGVAKVLLASSW